MCRGGVVLVDFGSKARVEEELNQAKDTGRDDGQKCLDNNNEKDF